MAKKEVTVTFNGGANFAAEVDGHTIQIDKAVESGGMDAGPRPKALMLAALGGCTGLDVVSILNKMRVPFTDFSITSVANTTDTEPSVYDKIVIRYQIRVALADRVKVEKAVHLSKEKYCGVSRMYESFAEIGFEIIFL